MGEAEPMLCTRTVELYKGGAKNRRGNSSCGIKEISSTNFIGKAMVCIFVYEQRNVDFDCGIDWYKDYAIDPSNGRALQRILRSHCNCFFLLSHGRMERWCSIPNNLKPQLEVQVLTHDP